MIYELTKEEVERCEEFALKCADTNLNRYRQRGQSSIDKIVKDIVTGKMGEIAVYNHLIKIETECTLPDFAIYEARKKSYDADLRSEDLKIHVKTQSQFSAEKYGVSWILQNRGVGDQDKLFKKRDDNDFVALCAQRSPSSIEIMTLLPVNFLFNNGLIEEPRLKWFVGVKSAIYWESIQKRINEHNSNHTSHMLRRNQFEKRG